MSKLSKLFSFWSGRPLGYLERLCIASVLAVGHSLDIFTYDPKLQAPRGVVVRDAREILPPRPDLEMAGQWTPISNFFRYEALLRGAGIWVDLDVLVLKPLDRMGDYLLGWQDGYIINNAVLRLPPGAPCLRRLVHMAQSPVVIPPHWGPVRQARQRLLALVGQHMPVEKLEWGTTGPLAITRVAHEERILHRCQPMDVFYPLPWQEAHLIFDPDAGLVERTLTSSTRAIHLWNARVEKLKEHPPRGSFIDRMCKRFGVEMPA
jgi:hypothetical protein